MNGYLLDTNICIYYIKGKHNLNLKFESIKSELLFISEITLAELNLVLKIVAIRKKTELY